MSLRILILLQCIFVCFIAKAQPEGREIVSQPINWFSLNSNLKLHKKFGLTTDAQIRFVDGFESMQHMGRIGIDVYLSKKFSFVPAGYSYIHNYQYGDQPVAFANHEHRIWQQIFFKHHISRIAISHRLRFEERFIQVHSKNLAGEIENKGFTNKQFRMRYRLLANIPLNHDKMDPKTLYISLWDEVFMSRGKQVTFHEPDQNRIFVGLGYQFTKQFAFQAGFLYQLLIKSNGAKQENNLGPLWQVNYNLDFTKKE